MMVKCKRHFIVRNAINEDALTNWSVMTLLLVAAVIANSLNY